VYVPGPVHDKALALLDRHADVAVGWGPRARGWADIASEVSGVLVRTEPLAAEDLAAAPQLRIIARHGVGTDNIDVDAATALGVPVAITPDANTRSVAEHAFALLLAVSRKLVLADRAVRDGRYDMRDTLVGHELAGKRLGIVGMGRIGSQVARIAQGFEMHVLGYDPQLSAPDIEARGAQPMQGLDQLLIDTDVLTVHVPLTPATKGLLGDAELDLLPSHALVLLLARGGVVDEAALIERLRDGRLAGAGVDVFEREPPPEDLGYFELPNVVLSPHTGAHTDAAMERMAVGAAEAIVAVLHGQPPAHVLNPAALAAQALPADEDARR
jgi:D-3-phosphoglycerate dehydrogenase / 2-oxoglutarate reductase